MSSYFYLHAEQNALNAGLIESLREYSDNNQTLIYVLDRPLTDQKYHYNYSKGLIILSPKNKIAIINCGHKNEKEVFENYVEDVIEDVGYISDKYLYKEVLGRTRKWKSNLIEIYENIEDVAELNFLLDELRVESDIEKKRVELLISLFIGSINDIDRVKEDVPETALDKVKQKIQLFDGDQTRFVYESPKKKRIRIQGLSGTGKTELLLHKLKDVYINDFDSKIFFTCYSRVLADSLQKRIPNFFNFMKVEQQIEWNHRLWCTNSWGSNSAPNSGAYRYICSFYKIPFYSWSYRMSFSKACQLAIDDIKSKYVKQEFKFALTYMFIDESQDFDENFFDLCDLVTEKNIYVAGDVFQSIFDENISSTIEPDFLLGKCYRTDPKTLMFAHGLGMGLFEETKLRWLEEKEWKDCGYNVNIESSKFYLSREPLRRFEDLEGDFESIEIVEIQDSFSDTVINILGKLKNENLTIQPDDIGIILLDNDQRTYKLADILEVKIEQNFGWSVNKVYETKERIPDRLFISNRNNVKGLEFPFVICITSQISDNPSYRNSLYTMLTRSFIKSFFLTQPGKKSGLTDKMKEGLKQIISNQEMIIDEPSVAEKELIQTRFKYSLKKLSHFDLMMLVFKELRIEQKYQDNLLQAAQTMNLLESDFDTLRDFVGYNMKYLPNSML